MVKAFGTAPAPTSSTKKAAARTALVDLKESSRALLTECFRQFGIETVVTSAGSAERLRLEKFEACVLNLGPGAEAVMEAARTSPSNSRIVLYGLGGNAQEAMRYSKYGINAMFLWSGPPRSNWSAPPTCSCSTSSAATRASRS
jgi:hypothetical protein